MAKSTPVIGQIVSDTTSTVHPDSKSLNGRYVNLEQFNESHLPSLWSSLGVHTELWAYWPSGPYATYDDLAKALTSNFEEENLVLYSVLLHGEAVGFLATMHTDLSSRVVEVGLAYGLPLQRTRAGTEAFYMLTCRVFDEMNSRRMEWKTDKLNESSRRAAERYGLKFEGCLRQHRICMGRNRDTVWYSMIDGEWPDCKHAFEMWLDDANFDDEGRQKEKLDTIRQRLTEASSG